MSLINEALKRAEDVGPNTETQPPKRSTHSVEHLYGDKVSTGPASSVTAAKEKLSRLLRKNQTSLGGAAALGVCVIAAVAMIMHLTLPPDQQSPVEAEAGGAPVALFETQTPPADEENRIAPDKTPEKSTIAALQQTLSGILSRNAAQTPKTTPPPEPAEAVLPAEGGQTPEGQKATDQFTLGGILASGGKGYAIINSHMVTVGDNVNGARVVAIGKHHVVLEKDGKQFTLRM